MHRLSSSNSSILSEILHNVRISAAIYSVVGFTGMLVFGVSEWLHTDPICPDNVHLVAACNSLSAALVFIFGFYGYWAALHLQHTMIFVLTFTLIVCSVLELCFGTIMYSLTGKALHNDTYVMLKEASDHRIKFFQIQKENGCCGAKTYKDWIKSPWWMEERKKRSNLVVPKSCCKVPGCEVGTSPFRKVVDVLKLYQQGCDDLIMWRRNLKLWITGSFTILGGLLHILAFFLLHCRVNFILALQQELVW